MMKNMLTVISIKFSTNISQSNSFLIASLCLICLRYIVFYTEWSTRALIALRQVVQWHQIWDSNKEPKYWNMVSVKNGASYDVQSWKRAMFWNEHTLTDEWSQIPPLMHLWHLSCSLWRGNAFFLFSWIKDGHDQVFDGLSFNDAKAKYPDG